MRLVSSWRIPKCFALHVTSSPSESRPDVLPPMARSPVAVVDRTCASTLRARSKHTVAGAATTTVTSTRATISGAGATMSSIPLEQIPTIPVQVLEHRHRPVGLHLRITNERDAECGHAMVVAPEVVGLEE